MKQMGSRTIETDASGAPLAAARFFYYWRFI
jgi:hypothetical protein